MKRKNIYIIISIAVFLIIALLIWWLLGRQAAINEDHISINFEIHNCSAVEANSELLKNDFLKPLLAHSVITENNGLEDLIITKVSCNSQAFSIPALGINSFRYNNSAPTLKESTMTSTSRSLDEEAFFSSWEADGYLNLENILIKGHPKHKDNNDLAYLAQIIKSEADELIPDSVIIDKTCQKEQSPFLFSSTANFRKFIDEQLKKNKNAFYENGKSGHIDIFIWCGDGYNLNPDDKDNDGVLNEFDKCPEQPGEKSNSGCPKNNDDEDEVEEIEITTTVNNPSESNEVSNVCLGSDRRLTWDGQMRSLKIRIKSSEIDDINKVVAQNQSISFSNEERENITQINPKRTPIKVEYFDPIKRKYKAVNVNTASDNIIHCYNLLP
jgi:hypothetical protein